MRDLQAIFQRLFIFDQELDKELQHSTRDIESHDVCNYKRLNNKSSLLWSCATSHQIYWEKQQKMFSFTFFFIYEYYRMTLVPWYMQIVNSGKKSQFSAHTVRIIFSIPQIDW